MSCYNNLISFHIIHRHDGSNLLTWTYPNISEKNKQYIIKSCFKLNIQPNGTFAYLRNENWIYIQESGTDDKNEGVAIIFIAKDFNPNKYETLCQVFLQHYLKSGDRVALVKLYVNIFVTSSCSLQENGSVITHNFGDFSQKGAVKEFVRKFGLNVILIYIAVLLKKRIIVYHSNITELQKDLLSITHLVTYRKPNDYLFPYVENARNELKAFSFFVAGVTSYIHSPQTEFYDLFVNLTNLEINISTSAKDCLSMTKIYKDLGASVVELAETNAKEEDVSSELSQKTADLLKQLKSLASKTPNGMITLEVLKEQNYSSAVENFLFHFAVAEDMMML